MIPKTIKQIFEVTERLKEKGWEYTFQVDIFKSFATNMFLNNVNRESN